jgi:hypothetical protein
MTLTGDGEKRLAAHRDQDAPHTDLDAYAGWLARPGMSVGGEVNRGSHGLQLRLAALWRRPDQFDGPAIVIGFDFDEGATHGRIQ